MIEAASRLLAGEITVQPLGAFVSTVDFLIDQLVELPDPTRRVLADHLETLEEVYAVALDRHWTSLPREEESLVRNAATAIQVLSKTSEEEST